MTFKILDFPQGSEIWHKERENPNRGYASLTAAIMGDDPQNSRDSVIRKLAGWKANGPSKFVQEKVFNPGHEAEEKQRLIVNSEHMVELLPIVAINKIDDVELWTSSDGTELSEDKKKVYFAMEHKKDNPVLLENVRNKTLEKKYIWQLETHMLTFEIDEILFVTSDGTSENKEEFFYKSDEKFRKVVAPAWKAALEEVKNYVFEAKTEAIEGEVMIELPAIALSFAGPDIVSNAEKIKMDAEEWRDTIKAAVHEADSKKLESEKDFEDRDKTNKALTKMRDDLKIARATIEKAFTDYSELNGVLLDIDSILQKSESAGKKAYKENKDIQKALQISTAKLAANAYVKECNAKVAPVTIGAFIANAGGFDAVIKGKSNLDKMQEAIDAELANVKIEMDQIVERVTANNTFLFGYDQHKHLFSDLQQIANKETVDFENIVKVRVAEFDKAEEIRIEAIKQKAIDDEKARVKMLADAEVEAYTMEEERKAAEIKKQEDEEVKKNVQVTSTKRMISSGGGGGTSKKHPERIPVDLYGASDARSTEEITNNVFDPEDESKFQEEEPEPFQADPTVDHSILSDGKLSIAMTSSLSASVDIGNGLPSNELKANLLKFLSDLGFIPF